jgi:hypothetical protein
MMQASSRCSRGADEAAFPAGNETKLTSEDITPRWRYLNGALALIERGAGVI